MSFLEVDNKNGENNLDLCKTRQHDRQGIF